jgi:hypothetical protein
MTMNITILLDHDLEGRAMFFEAGLRKRGWDQYRQSVADKLALVVIEIDNYLGTGRVFLP